MPTVKRWITRTRRRTLDWVYELIQHTLGVATIVDCFSAALHGVGGLGTSSYGKIVGGVYLGPCLKVFEHVVIMTDYLDAVSPPAIASCPHGGRDLHHPRSTSHGAYEESLLFEELADR